jgi:hypothetical protein
LIWIMGEVSEFMGKTVLETYTLAQRAGMEGPLRFQTTHGDASHEYCLTC